MYNVWYKRLWGYVGLNWDGSQESCPSTEEHTSLSRAQREPRAESERKANWFYLRKSFLTICVLQKWNWLSSSRAGWPSVRVGQQAQHPEPGRAGWGSLAWFWQPRVHGHGELISAPKKRTTGWKAGLTVSIWGFAFSPSENWREKVTTYSREFVDNFDSLLPSIYSVSGYFLLD